MSRFWSDAARNITPYTAGEQPKDKTLIKLNTNENPYPPSPKVAELLKATSAQSLKLYPDPQVAVLKEAASRFYNVPWDRLFFGNGSDEILAFAFMAFLNNGDKIAFPDITYSFYPVYSQLFNVPFNKIPLKEDFSIDLAAYPENLKAILLANPNAPTGVALPLEAIEREASRRPDTLLIVDEAYIDFGGESAVILTLKRDNVLVIQTLSKSRSLAGLRIGAAIGDPALIEGFERIKNSFNSYTLDYVAQYAAAEAYKDVEYFNATRKKIMETREWTGKELTRLGARVSDSLANFLYVRLPGWDGAEAQKYLRQEGILVRHFKGERTGPWLRITIGTDEEMQKVVQAVEKMLQTL